MMPDDASVSASPPPFEADDETAAMNAPPSPFRLGAHPPMAAASSSSSAAHPLSSIHIANVHVAPQANAAANGGGVTLGSGSLAWLLACTRSIECHYVLFALFFIYLVVVPMALVLEFYLSFGEMLLSAVVGVAIPVVLGHLIWRHMLALNPALVRVTEHASVKEAFLMSWRMISKHWTYEMYQLLLTFLSVSTYLFYTYNLSYDLDEQGRGNYTMRMPSTEQFVQTEYFVIISLSLDYMLRLLTAPNPYGHIFSFYSFIDLLCFTSVAYFNFFHGQLAPQDVTYNFYLFQGPFRLFRMRRALQSLDAPIRLRSGIALYRLGPFVVRKKTAFMLLFTLRVFLYIATAAAFVLACEFPCVKIIDPSQGGNCSPALHSFHICFYFIIVTLSTVGYGDVSCATDFGRMLMCGVIVYAAVQVPKEIQMFADLETEQRKYEQEQAEEERRAREAQLLQQQHSLNDSEQLRSISPTAAAVDVPATSAVGSSSVVSSTALQHFMANDTSFLCRWAEMRLATTHPRDAALLQRLADALGVDAKSDLPEQQKIAAVVHTLFGEQPRA